MKINAALACATILASLSGVSPSAASAQEAFVVANPAPGAMPHDKSMTCEMIATERAEVQNAITERASKAQRMAKTKKSLFGFARTMASVMAPGAAQVLGGSSPLGALAAQGLGQSASQAINTLGTTDTAAVPAQPLDQEQARLVRLEAISAYRQCAA